MERAVVQFEGESVTRLDSEQTLNRLRDLYKAMHDANNCKSLDNRPVLFNMHYLMADVLEAINILSFNNLSKVIGIANAGRIWGDVKNQKQ